MVYAVLLFLNVLVAGQLVRPNKTKYMIVGWQCGGIAVLDYLAHGIAVC